VAVGALLLLLADPDVGELVSAMKDQRLRDLYAQLLGRLVELRDQVRR